MSHFSVCVIVPDDGVVNNIHANNLEDHLIPVLAPFDEQTEEEKYREFEDRTEEAKADFENDTMRVVRFPDGSIHSIYDDAFNKSFFIEEDRIYAFGSNRDRKSKLQTEQSKALELVTDYPVKSWYPSLNKSETCLNSFIVAVYRVCQAGIILIIIVYDDLHTVMKIQFG